MNKIHIDKEKIVSYYLNENHSIDECCENFGVSRTTFKAKLRNFGIHKDKKLSLELSQKKVKAKYGNHPFKNREKIKKILLEKYGVDNPMKNLKIKKKVQETNLRKYKSCFPNQNKDIRKKIENTNLKKYGVKCIFENKKIKEEALKKCEELYGNKYPLASSNKDSLLKKRKNTNLKKYGAEEITQSEYFKKCVKKKCLEKYGTTSPNESIYSATIFKDKDSCKKYLIERFSEKPSIQEIMKDLSLSDSCILKKIHDLDCDDFVDIKPKKSSKEKEIIEFINELGISSNDIISGDRNILDGLEIDIFLPKYNLGIEFNGTYWHSSIYKKRKYHQEKSLKCEEKGIRLIHIYEYEWECEEKRKILKSIIRNALGLTENIIFARKCEIKNVSKEKARIFLNKNHIQGFRGANKSYGLYFNNELMQIMTFGKNKIYGWEIIREASLFNTRIVGGSSRLLKKFLKEESPKSVFSYCDFNKFSGNGYKSIGMKFIGITVPDMKWIINGKAFNRNPSKNAEMKKLAEAQIFGAGSKKFLLTNKI